MTTVRIEALDHEGRGVGHVEGKVVFVEGALIGETAQIEVYRRKPQYECATTRAILSASAWRTAPRCRYFGVCGGCSMQHLEASAQAAIKQRTLEDALWHVGRVRPGRLLPVIQGPSWGYRHRARLSARLVPRKGGVLVGFHERRSSYVADMTSCEILPERVSALLPALRGVIHGTRIADRIPQVEVAVAEGIVGLVVRILEPLCPEDEASFRRFAEQHSVRIYLQTGGPDSVAPFHPPDASATLEYRLPEFDVTIGFRPTDFTQVNHAVNRILVRRAMQLLQPGPGERIADLFCGLGNFTLPIARLGAEAIGIEGHSGLVERARANARANGLADRARFESADLFQWTPEDFARLGPLDKLLIDPPREGAIAVVKALPRSDGPARIVYVSCSPATLARDAGVLVSQHGYRLEAAGVVNMFPHTSHVESVALFTLE